jgi:hypothetical protein
MAMAVMQALYAVWAFTDPTALAAYRGTPLHESGDTAWVQAYGSRTLFVASVVALLLIRKDVTNLRWVALLGLVMPLSDALVALRADLPPAVVYRHVGTGIYLLITFAALARWKRTATT